MRHKDNANNFRDKGYDKRIMLQSDEFYKFFKDDKGVKFVSNESPVSNLVILDVSLNARGPVEDRVFSDFPFYRDNIRRGNTLARLKNGDVIWLRKGLKKFFDIDVNMLRGDKKGDNEHYATFRQIQNILSCNSQFEHVDQKAKLLVHKLLKANGENAQISYTSQCDCWVIASKNVCLLARDREDLKRYNEQRYNFAVLIAQSWFDILDKSKITKDQYQDLKKEMDRVTLVGEYCGNPECQHIVKYNEISILFYAVVEKQSKQTCIPVDSACAFFKKYNLPVVNDIHKSFQGQFTDFKQFTEFLLQLFEKVSGGRIEQEEQGCVLYFTLEVPSTFNDWATEAKMQQRFFVPEKYEKTETRVVSLTKLKTLQYRIWRKLREKLKRVFAIQEKDQADIKKQLMKLFGKYEMEMRDLIGKVPLQKPIQYYLLVGLKAYEYGFKNIGVKGAFDLPLSAFIDFLNILMHSVQNNIELTPDMVNDKQLILKLRSLDWSTLRTNVKEEYVKMEEAFFPEYGKIKKIKQIEPQEPQ